MTHKIKVQMFGNFRMDYNGAPFVAEKMHKESQFNRMMQALIHYSDCGIAKDKLEEIVIGERDIDAPHTALRVIVYKTKQKLAQLGLPGKNLIYLEGGIYYWTPDIEIEEDAAEFEKLYNEACALEKQMPQEPESAETVCDERIKEIEDNMLELYVKALYLYKGEFLAAYTGETWIAQEARRYHTMFEKIVNEAAYILRKRKQFKRLEKLGVYAAKVDPFNEWEELIMEAMVETRRYDEAEELYTDVVDYYLRECGIYPSSRLLEILEKYSNQMNHAHLEIQRLDLDNVDNRKNLIIGLTGFTSVTAWAKLYSTKFIREHNLRFIEDVYYEDTHFSMLCVLLAKKYCKVQSALYYYFENTEGIIRSEISNAKIRDAKIIMDHIRQAIQSRKAELGNVIEQCYCEIQTFLLWHQYIEPYSRIETFMNRELDICKEEFLKSEPDIFNNPYVKFFSDNVILKRMSKLRVTAKKMDNAYFLDNATIVRQVSIMYGDTWQVRWKEFLSDSYVYGSKIEFNEDGSVSYKNRLMPPGTVIHTWYSMTNFQGNRIEPSLPLIDGERAYSIAVNIDYHNSESEALMLRIIFFDRYDVQAQSIIVRDKKAFFKPSIRTYSYRIELINGGNADFTFKSLVIKEVSEEEFDAEQERIERLKEDSNKSKKKRRKNKKSK